jgi:hypothetical protein
MFFKRSTKRRVIHLQSGSVRFVIPIDENETKNWDTDLLILKLLIEELEQKHQLTKRDDGTFETNTNFLAELSTTMERQGCPRCTPTMARQVWLSVTEQFAILEQRFRIELAKATR